jgi:hypothetical protein
MDADPSCALHAFGSSMTLGETRLLISVAPAQAGAYHVYRQSAALSGETR